MSEPFEKPDWTRSLLLLGLAQVDNGNFTDALDVTRQYKDLRPHDPAAHLLEGSIHLKLDQCAAAQKSFMRYLDLMPEDHQGLAYLATAYFGNKDYALAQETFDRYLTLNPEDTDARKCLDVITLKTAGSRPQ